MGLASAAFVAAHALSPSFLFSQQYHYSMGLGAAAFSVLVLFLSYILGVYDRHNFTSLGRMAGQAISVNTLSMAATSVIFGWLGYVQIGRFVVLGAILVSATATFLCRLAARESARRAKVRMLLVGPRKKFRPLAAQIRLLYSDFYQRPVHFGDSSADSISERRARLAQAVRLHGPDEIVVMDDDPALGDLLHHSAAILKSGCGIFSYGTYYEKLLGQVPIDNVDGRGILAGGFDAGSLQTGFAKRPLDIVLASFGLLIGAPLMLLCAVLVKLTSPGPVVYEQTRVGRYGRTFSIYKFRTMRHDAERNGAVWAKAADARITPIGRLLRRSRFDELPQLWNILRGDMALVGPRPERPEFVEKLRQQIPHYELRHLVPPGLTGWAQVRFRYGASIEDAQRKLAFDLYYVRNCGLTFDIAVCLRTLVAMAKGAR